MGGQDERPSTIPRLAPTPVAPPRTASTTHEPGPKLTTPGPEPTPAPFRAATSTAAGERPRWCGATSGPARDASAEARGASRASARRAVGAPSSPEVTTTSTSARTARSIVGRPGAGSATTPASGAAAPRASIREPSRISTVMPPLGPRAPAGRARRSPGEAAGVHRGVAGDRGLAEARASVGAECEAVVAAVEGGADGWKLDETRWVGSRAAVSDRGRAGGGTLHRPLARRRLRRHDQRRPHYLR